MQIRVKREAPLLSAMIHDPYPREFQWLIAGHEHSDLLRQLMALVLENRVAESVPHFVFA
jgi:hypothetical protein